MIAIVSAKWLKENLEMSGIVILNASIPKSGTTSAASLGENRILHTR
ncbi:MAG: hypothetical protein ACOH2D_00195 [Gelidibacter sp.]